VLLDIQESDFARIELVINNRASEQHRGTGSRSVRTLVYRWSENRYRIGSRTPDPVQLADCSDILSACPQIEGIWESSGPAGFYALETIDAIRANHLDVMVLLADVFVCGEALTAPRYGVWFYHYGDSEFYRGGPPLLWEVMENDPCSVAMLRIMDKKPGDGLILCKSVFPTSRAQWRRRNLFQPYWGSSHFVIRKLHQLHEKGWESVQRQAARPAPYRGKKPAYREPGNLQMLRWMAPQAAQKLKRRLSPWRASKVYHWNICLRRADSPALLADGSAGKSGFEWMPCPMGHVYADPVLVERQGDMWLFFEDYIYGKKRGRISVARVEPDGTVGEPTVCLDLPYHLSYPFVFEHEGEMFMIPETVRNGCAELWRAVAFPHAWTREKTLFNGPLVDTTPLFHEGRWYFFTGFSERSGRVAFGGLFSAATLTSDWERHPACPISTDVRDARSAGAILRAGNRLLRPVQDGSEAYGRRIHVEEILELSPGAYRSRRLHSIEPDWAPHLTGTHTYGFCNGIEVLDAASRVDPRKVGAALNAPAQLRNRTASMFRKMASSSQS
jgi:hypothetical protein